MTDWRTEIRRGDRVIRFAGIVCVIAVGVIGWMVWTLADAAEGQESVTAHDSCDPAEGFANVPSVGASQTGESHWLHTSGDGWCRSRQGWRITNVRVLLTTQSGRPGSVPWVTYSSAAKQLGRLCNNARTACHAAGSDSEPCPLSPSTPGYYYRTHLRVHTYGYSVANPAVTFHHVRDLNSARTYQMYACGQRQP